MSDACFIGSHGVEAAIQKVRDDIERVGWSIIGVGSGEGHPGFCYTVGLTKLAHPEVVVVGSFPPVAMMHVLNGMGRRVKEGYQFTEGWHDNVLERFVVPVRRVLQTALDDHFGMCNRLFGQGKFTGIQLFLPDRMGRFPDDRGCDVVFRDEQRKFCAVEPPVARIVN